jgi:hypothetical protein
MQVRDDQNPDSRHACAHESSKTPCHAENLGGAIPSYLPIYYYLYLPGNFEKSNFRVT